MTIKFIVFPLLFILSFHLNAQEETKEKIKRFEIGLNATRFITTNFLNKSGTTYYPYDFMINYRLSEDTYLRSGHSISISSFDNDDNRETKRSNFGTRFGFSKRDFINSKFFINYGPDLLFNRSKESTISTSNNNVKITTTDKTYSFGIGMFLGIGYEITSRLSLRTETSLFYKYIISKQTFDIKPNTGQEKEPESITNTYLGYSSPITILFFIKL